MEWLLRLDRVLQATMTAGIFWMVAGLAYYDVFEDGAVTRRARAVELLIDGLLVGLFGRIGATILFLLLGAVAGIAILRRGSTD